MDLTIVITNIRVLMAKSNWNQSDMADKAGIRRATLNQLLKGKHEPSLDTLDKIAEALGVPMLSLLDGTERARPPKDQEIEDAAKWREFEAKYLLLGQDLIEKLMTIDLKDKIYLWDYFGLPEHPNILAAKRKIRVEAHKQESKPAPHKQAVDYFQRKK